MVGADRQRAQREELVSLRLDIAVEEHLLALHGRARLRVRPGRRVRQRRATVGRVLGLLEGSAVVPPGTAPDRHREVGLLGPGADLLEERLAQRLQVGGHLLRVRVLGLEVGDHVRV